MNFDQAFEKLIGHEGGYVNNEKDPGGETNFGISKRSYPDEDIKGMTPERAKALYLRDFWTPLACDELPAPIRFDVFDMAVNSGKVRAARMLQQAVFAQTDGVIGPRTLTGIRTMNPDCLIRRFNGLRLEFMTGLQTWDEFGRGWARRIAANLQRV